MKKQRTEDKQNEAHSNAIDSLVWVVAALLTIALCGLMG